MINTNSKCLIDSCSCFILLSPWWFKFFWLIVTVSTKSELLYHSCDVVFVLAQLVIRKTLGRVHRPWDMSTFFVLKTWEFAKFNRLAVRPWEVCWNRENHGQIVRVDRYGQDMLVELLGVVLAPANDTPGRGWLTRDGRCAELRSEMDSCQGSSPNPTHLWGFNRKGGGENGVQTNVTMTLFWKK